ncbi:GNAT family N-acetyltransferase [Streptomyces sp. NPDC017529]|uniref:GNAT family N-acetyltransferase n=1 Tax=Streptomyces sp. NPDC017529 TaxID=3365000 RepID=UPI0037AD14CF
MTADILKGLDALRRSAGEPAPNGVVREPAPDGSECRIVHSRCTADELDTVIAEEAARAKAAGYSLEWKVYEHDTPAGLGDRLRAAGFAADDAESVLVLPVDEGRLADFGTSAYEIRRVDDEEGLRDYAEISREIGRENAEEEAHRLLLALGEAPGGMSVYVAYVDGEPAACGRVYFPEGSGFAELAGGRTKTTHRKRGLFTALVAARLREARERGRTHVLVDALPTSEPILRKMGFRFVTRTRPFVLEPGD